MITELYVDRAVYAVDDESRTYRFVRRNPEWERLDSAENRLFIEVAKNPTLSV